jgi:hypothetical protein
MDDAERLVVDHYPVEKLPADLREGHRFGTEVRVIIESTAADDEPRESIIDILSEMQDERVFAGNPVDRIRALRAEWDWRDEFHARIRDNDA